MKQVCRLPHPQAACEVWAQLCGAQVLVRAAEEAVAQSALIGVVWQGQAWQGPVLGKATDCSMRG